MLDVPGRESARKDALRRIVDAQFPNIDRRIVRDLRADTQCVAESTLS